MNVKFYQVGGCVRDRLMGLKPKDIDFSVEAESYEAMRAAIVERVGRESRIKVEKPEFVTIRAVDAKLGGVDFVLCRQEGDYSDGRRPDTVRVGSLADDLARRDFTVNAMAEDDDGRIIDLFGGQEDLRRKLLRCVGNAKTRLTEDSLRMLRAIRFMITKGFSSDEELEMFLRDKDNAELLRNISIERVREELKKCFDYDTLKTLKMLSFYDNIRNVIFSQNLKLEPTVTHVRA
jgi:tRNA nucleotidyltransferase (CCA-adding enzyme)